MTNVTSAKCARMAFIKRTHKLLTEREFEIKIYISDFIVNLIAPRRQLYEQKEFIKIYHRFASLDAKNDLQRVSNAKNQFNSLTPSHTRIGVFRVFIIELNEMFTFKFNATPTNYCINNEPNLFFKRKTENDH